MQSRSFLSILQIGSLIACLPACSGTIQAERVSPGYDYKRSSYITFEKQDRHLGARFRDVLWPEVGVGWRYWDSYPVNRGGASTLILFNIQNPRHLVIFIDAESQDPIARELAARMDAWEKTLGPRHVGVVRGMTVRFSSGEDLASQPWVDKKNFIFDMPGLESNFKIVFAGRPVWSAYVGEVEVLDRKFRFLIASMAKNRNAGQIAALIFETLNPLRDALDNYLAKRS